MLNMNEYDYIYLNKQSAEFARILNMSDAVHNIRSLNKLGHFNDQGNILEFFLLDTLKTTFWMEIITQKWIQPGFFFPKIRMLLSNFKKCREVSPLYPDCVPIRVAQYASNPWICLNILENVWINCSAYAMALNMSDDLHVCQVFEDASGYKSAGFWIWHGCICKGYTEFQICLNMAKYASVMLEHAWICLNAPQYPWKCLKKLLLLLLLSLLSLLLLLLLLLSLLLLLLLL